jgi:hypothetical protein
MRLIAILFYVIILMLLIPLLTIYLFDSSSGDQMSSSTSLELQLANRLVELSDRIKHAEMLSMDRKRDINALKNNINSFKFNINLNNNNLSETNFFDLVNNFKLKGIYCVLKIFLYFFFLIINSFYFVFKISFQFMINFYVLITTLFMN